MRQFTQESIIHALKNLDTDETKGVQMMQSIIMAEPGKTKVALLRELTNFIMKNGSSQFLHMVDQYAEKEDKVRFTIMKFLRKYLLNSLLDAKCDKKTLERISDELDFNLIKILVPEFIPEESFILTDFRVEPKEIFPKDFNLAVQYGSKSRMDPNSVLLERLRYKVLKGHYSRLSRFAGDADFRSAEAEFKAMVKLIGAVTNEGDLFGGVSLYQNGLRTLVNMYERLGYYQQAQEYAKALLDSMENYSSKMDKATKLYLKMSANKVVANCLRAKDDDEKAYKLVRRMWNEGNRNMDLVRKDPRVRLELAQTMNQLNDLHRKIYGNVDENMYKNCFRLFKSVFSELDDVEMYQGFAQNLYNLYADYNQTDLMSKNISNIIRAFDVLKKEGRIQKYRDKDIDFSIAFLGTMIGLHYKEKGEGEKAIGYFEDAFRVNRKMVDQHLPISLELIEVLMNAGINLTSIYYDLGEYKALQYARLTEKYARILMESNPKDEEYKENFLDIHKLLKLIQIKLI